MLPAFLAPGFLWGLSLVGIPILIHLFQRRRFQVVKWAAMEFLLQSQKQQRKRLIVEQLLLLLLRCLALALVALSASRPVLRSGVGSFLGARGPIHAVILLDNSGSMGYRVDGAGDRTAFDRARERAVELITRTLRQGDAVSVILASDPPSALIRRPTLDLKAAADAIRRAERTDAGTSFGRAARLAVRMLGETTHLNREVFLVSDQQLAGWEGGGGDPEAWETLVRGARVTMVSVRDGAPENLAVDWVQPVRGLATARAGARIQARIVNTGNRPVRGLRATLEIDGKPHGTAQVLDLDGGQSGVVTFSASVAENGVHRCIVRIAPDRLPGDDAGYLALPVRSAVRVLIVNGAPNPAAPQRDAAFFLEPALSPPSAAVGAEPSPVEATVVSTGALGRADIRRFDVVVLSGVSGIQETERRVLGEFVQRGGGLLVFPGPNANIPLYNRDLFERSPGLLPARLGSVKTEVTALDSNSFEHAALQRFRGAQDVDVNTADFRRWYGLELPANDRQVRVIARFANGAAALVQRDFGLGHVIMSASTATTEWNSLPLKPVFVPLLHQLTAYLASGSDTGRNGLVGDPVIRPLPLEQSARPVSVTTPDGKTFSVRPAVDAVGCRVTVDQTRAAGFYEMTVGDGESEDTFAVNRRIEESYLKSLDEKALRERMPSLLAGWVRSDEDLLTALTRSRYGMELWRPLLIAALCCLLLESFLAQKFGRRA